MKTLQEIVQSHKSLDELMIENGGELTDEQQEQIVMSWMAEIASDLTNKADGYKYRQDTLDAASEALKARAKMFSNAAKVLENMSESLKDRMKSAMIELGKDEIVSNDFKFKITQGKDKLVFDPKLIDKKYEIPKISIDYDKDAIKADLEGGEVTGAMLQPVYTLRISANKKIKELN